MKVIRSIAAVTARWPECLIAARPAASSHSFITAPPCTKPPELASVIAIHLTRIDAESDARRGSIAGDAIARDPRLRFVYSEPSASLDELARRIHACRRCPRLVAWREATAAAPPRRYAGEDYWARPVAGF